MTEATRKAIDDVIRASQLQKRVESWDELYGFCRIVELDRLHRAAKIGQAVLQGKDTQLLVEAYREAEAEISGLEKLIKR